MHTIYPSELSNLVSIESVRSRGKLLEGIFSVRDSGIDSKIFHSWKMADLLSTVERGKWASLSFIDLIWLRTLESLRKFGCSHKIMKAIHEELFIKAYKENLAKKTMLSNVEQLANLSKQRPLTLEENEFLESTKSILNDTILMSTTNLGVNYFYQLVLKCFINENEVGLVIYEDGSFSSYEFSLSVQSGINAIDLTVPHLRIPISSFIKQFVTDEEKEQFLKPTGILNEQEYEVVKQIRNKNIKRITITFNNDSHSIEKIEPEVSGMIKGEEAKRIMQLLGLNNYSGIELHTRDGKSLAFTQTNKIYMSNKVSV
jgi:hypothetical protein